MRIALPALLTLALTTACSAGAGEADIKKNIETRFPRAKVDSVSKTPMAGVYEVVINGSVILYSDAKGDYVIEGELLDTKSQRSLTQARMEKLMEVKFDTLPLNQAIKQVKGNGSRKVAVFSDPDCPYCRKVQEELAKLDNVSIYVFAYPLPMHQDATRKSKLIWCSPDPAKAWDDFMLRGKLPEGGKTDCPNPIEANLALGQKLRVEGTPALIFASGKRVPGYIKADRIEAMLAEPAK